VSCKTQRTFTAIISRCDLNSKIGQEYLDFLGKRGYIATRRDGERTTYVATEQASEYIDLFTRICKGLFDKGPGFRL
jgi:predicted transcriptional regulator